MSSGAHRSPEGQGRNGVTITDRGGGGGLWVWSISATVGDMAKISQFYHDSLSFIHVGFSMLQVV